MSTVPGEGQSAAHIKVATLIERYFTDWLIRQRNVSPSTIASYRTTFRLLFTFAQAFRNRSS